MSPKYVIFVMLFLVSVAMFITGAVTGNAQIMAMAFVLTAALFLARRTFLK